MRTLVLGAGAIGGYFGGRLLEAGRDVSFLVRPARAAALARSGLRIRSPVGDATLPAPPTVVAAELHERFDLVLLTAKAYDLEDAIESFAPAVGGGTAILPLLNGVRHLDVLDARFGVDHMLGGQCVIAATLNADQEIVHLNDRHALSFGERDGSMSDRVTCIAQLMAGARFESRASTEIVLEMWEKWVFLASLAACTCLMRAPVGVIASVPGGVDLALGLLGECVRIAAAEGHPVRPALVERARAMLTDTSSTLTASMLRDMERNAAIEADHVIGDLLARARRHGLTDADVPLLTIVYARLSVYERIRTQSAAAAAR